jgi:hypothetical protein
MQTNELVLAAAVDGFCDSHILDVTAAKRRIESSFSHHLRERETHFCACIFLSFLNSKTQTHFTVLPSQGIAQGDARMTQSSAQGNARMTQCNAKMTQGIDKMTQGESEGPRQGKPGNYTVLVVFPTPPRGLLLGVGRRYT